MLVALHKGRSAPTLTRGTAAVFLLLLGLGEDW